MLLRIYIKVLIIIAAIFVTFGYFAPWLISSDDSLLVVMGVVLIAIALPALVVAMANVAKSIEKYNKEKSES